MSKFINLSSIVHGFGVLVIRPLSDPSIYESSGALLYFNLNLFYILLAFTAWCVERGTFHLVIKCVCINMKKAYHSTSSRGAIVSVSLLLWNAFTSSFQMEPSSLSPIVSYRRLYFPISHVCVYESEGLAYY